MNQRTKSSIGNMHARRVKRARARQHLTRNEREKCERDWAAGLWSAMLCARALHLDYGVLRVTWANNNSVLFLQSLTLVRLKRLGS